MPTSQEFHLHLNQVVHLKLFPKLQPALPPLPTCTFESRLSSNDRDTRTGLSQTFAVGSRHFMNWSMGRIVMNFEASLKIGTAFL